MNTERRRPTIEVTTASGGWPAPWPSVAELAETLPAESWTLVGGLMTQLHTIHHGLGVVRPTNDVDIVLHIETMRGAPNKVATALEALGYDFQPSIDPRNKPHTASYAAPRRSIWWPGPRIKSAYSSPTIRHLA